jgi:hypothetical protein
LVQLQPDPPTGLPGAIAQLGERLLCKQEVTGSIPVGSTRHVQSASLSAIAHRCILFERFFVRLLFNNPEEVKRIRFLTWNRINWV